MMGNNNESLVLEDIPDPPTEPDPDECCGSGCIRCVYDIYDIQLDNYNNLVKKIKERNQEKLERIKQISNNNENDIVNNVLNNNSNNNSLDSSNNSIQLNKKEESTLTILYKEEEKDKSNGICENNNNTALVNNISKQSNILDNNKDYLFNTLFENSNLKVGKIDSYQVLSGENSPHKIYHLDIKSEEPVVYKPGDYISILCPQDLDLVNKLMKRIKINPNTEIKIKINNNNSINNSNNSISNINNNNNRNSNSNNSSNNKINKFNNLPTKKYCKIIDIFTWAINLSFIPPQYFLRVMVDYCNDQEEKKKLLYLSSSQGQQLYNSTIVSHQMNWVSVLCKFKSCNLPLDIIFLNIPPHETRKYSISSSPLPFNIHITFNLVKIIENSNKSNNKISKERFGLCTHWMHNQIQLFKQLVSNNNSSSNKPSVYLPFTIEESKGFNLPNSLETPIILIATGTGIAPFRSFLHQRYYQIQDSKSIHKSKEIIGECLLFFGCRRKDWDNLYNDELLNFKKDSIISKLYITFSQESNNSNSSNSSNNSNQGNDSNNKVYINKLIEENGELIYNLVVNQNAIVYVCGSKNKIGKSINDSLIEIIKKYNKFNIKTNEEASGLLDIWLAQNKYRRDVWN